jgi:hypothetical protein
MQTGLLWYDDDPQRPLEAKISLAAERYRDKYGRLPDTCYVHPQAVAGHPAGAFQVTCHPAAPAPQPSGHRTPAAGAPDNGTVRIISAPNILVNHFWLGENAGS